MSPRTKNWLLDNWPLIAVAATALIAWGSLQARVSQVEKDVAATKTDHDVLIEVRTDVSNIKKVVDRIDRKLDAQELNEQRPHR